MYHQGEVSLLLHVELESIKRKSDFSLSYGTIKLNLLKLSLRLIGVVTKAKPYRQLTSHQPRTRRHDKWPMDYYRRSGACSRDRISFVIPVGHELSFKVCLYNFKDIFFSSS